MSLNLTYPALIPDHELLTRLLGPDTTGAFVVITEATRDTASNTTRVTCRPVPQADLTRMVRDEFGYFWLAAKPQILQPPVERTAAS